MYLLNNETTSRGEEIKACLVDWDGEIQKRIFSGVKVECSSKTLDSPIPPGRPSNADCVTMYAESVGKKGKDKSKTFAKAVGFQRLFARPWVQNGW